MELGDNLANTSGESHTQEQYSFQLSRAVRKVHRSFYGYYYIDILYIFTTRAEFFLMWKPNHQIPESWQGNDTTSPPAEIKKLYFSGISLQPPKESRAEAIVVVPLFFCDFRYFQCITKFFFIFVRTFCLPCSNQFSLGYNPNQLLYFTKMMRFSP